MIWTGNYFQFKNMNCKVDAPGISTLSDAVLHKNNLVVMAPSYLIQPIGCHNVGELDLSRSDWETINNGGLTCTQSFNLLALSTATQQLLETAKSKKSLSKIPTIGVSYNTDFPYNTGDSMKPFYML
jgi:hypothetical protein